MSYQQFANRFAGETDDARTEIDNAVNEGISRSQNILQSELFKNNRAFAEAQDMREKLEGMGLGLVEGQKAYKVAREAFTKRFGKKEPVESQTPADSDEETEGPEDDAGETTGGEGAEDVAEPEEPEAVETGGEVEMTEMTGLAAREAALGVIGGDMPVPLPGRPLQTDVGSTIQPPSASGVEPQESTADESDHFFSDMVDNTQIGEDAVRGRLGSVVDGLQTVGGKVGATAEMVGERVLPAVGTGLAGYEAGDDISKSLGASKKASMGVGIGLGAVEGLATLAVPEAAPFILGADLLGDTLFDMFHKHKDKVPKPPPQAPSPVNPLQQGNIALPSLTTSAQ